MAVDPAAREQLLASLRAMLGPEEAATMDELLPPDDVGTTARFDRLDAHLADHDRRLDGIDHRLAGHDRRFDQIDDRLDQHDRRFDQIDDRLDQHDRRFDQIDDRFDQHDRRFDQIDDRFVQIDQSLQSLDHRMDTLRYELIAAFRGEVVSAVSGQTRAVLLGVVTASVAMFGMSVGVAQLM